MLVQDPRPTRSETSLVCACVVLLGALSAFAPSAESQSDPLAFTTLAGLPNGNEDGPKTQARLSYPYGVAVDGAGYVYVSDQYNNKIRKVAASGSVTTIAGCGTASADDGPGAQAMFSYPAGIARDSAGNLYVADQWNNSIRKVTPDGTVTKLSGFWGGFQDGPASLARFSSPSGVAVDGAGNVYVADSGNNRIRKVTPDGTASTLAGNGGYGFAEGAGTVAQFRNPVGVAVDGSGNVFVTDKGNNRIRKVAPDGTVSTLAGDGNWGFADGAGTSAQFRGPMGVAVDGSGNVFVGDESNHRIRKVASTGTVTTLAGDGNWGLLDGAGTVAQFRNPIGVAVDGSGNILVADSFNNRIRKVAPDGTVATLTGNGTSSFGYAEGVATVARFGFPMGLVVTPGGDVYFPDQVFNRIRKVASSGTVSLVAGNGNWGYVDGPGSAAEFRRPMAVALDGPAGMIVADAGNNRIRRVAPDGTVTTIAGDGNWGFVNGPAATARFANPSALAVDGAGNIYVGESGNHAIRKILPDGTVSTVAGDGQAGYADGPGTTARFNDPNGIVVGGDGALYVTDQWNAVIRRVAPDGTVSTFAGAGWGFADGPGSTARFRCPYGIGIDVQGNLYVGDQWNHRVRKVAPDGTVSTVGGSGAAGGLDGTGTSAGFSFPTGVVAGFDSSIYVMDTNNNAVRVGRTATVLDSATIDLPFGTVGTPRQLGTSPQTASSRLWQLTGIPPGSAATLSSTSAPNPTFTPDVIGGYTFRLTATASGGAVGISEVRLVAYVPATATVSGGGTICAGMTATVQATLSGAPPWTLTWSDGLVQSGIPSSPVVRSLSPTGTTTYSVTAVTDFNAAGTPIGSATVTVAGVAPSAAISAPNLASPVQAGLAASVPDAGAGATYAWTATNGTITSAPNVRSITFTTGTTPFTVLGVTVTTPGGCTSSGTRDVRVAAVASAPLAYTTLAGVTTGNEDGLGTGARFAFSWQAGVAVDAAGHVYVGDANNHVVRRIAPDGRVSTLAGAGRNGFLDGQSHLAQFSLPLGVVVDGSGNAYVAESWGHRVRRIAPDGTVSTFAGTGEQGYQDGLGGVARFASPWGLARDVAGNLYVADSNNHRIRKVSPDGTVSTLAGSGTAGWADGPGSTARFNMPVGVAVDTAGQVFVVERNNHRVRKVAPDGTVSTVAGTGNVGMVDGPGSTAEFASPMGVAVDASGNVFVADEWNNCIRKVTPGGTVSTFVGSTWGYLDGVGTAAQIRGPGAVAVDASGNLYIADGGNARVRKVAPDRTVTTLAGSGPEVPNGQQDGTGSAARFSGPTGVAIDASGNAFVADQWNNRIRKVTSSGVVTTVAGDGNQGWTDGQGTFARFNMPLDLAVDASGNVYVSDVSNHRIRKVSPDATVSTLAGTGTWGFADGPGTTAQFNNPFGVALDGAGNLYVADSNNHRVRKVTPDGVVTTVAGTGTPGYQDGPVATALLNRPQDVAVDPAGNVLVADQGTQRIRRISTDGMVTTLSGNWGPGSVDGPASQATFSGPSFLALDGAGNLFVSEYGNRIRRVAPDGSVTTVGGDGLYGGNDGLGTSAHFRVPQGLAVAADGALYVADATNAAIRVARAAALTDAATIDAVSGPVGQTRQLGTTGPVATSWDWRIVRQPPGSTAALSSTSVRTPTFVGTTPGFYRFRLTASNGGAESVTEASLLAYVPATATVSGGGTICQGLTATVQAALTGAPPWSLTWSDGVEQTGLTTNPVVRVVSPAVTTSYSVTAVSDSNGVGTPAGSATVTISGVAPSATITAPLSALPGQAGLLASVPDAGGGAGYVWTLTNGSVTAGAGTRSITFTAGASGWIRLGVTVTSGGCARAGERSLLVAIPPPSGPIAWRTLAGRPMGAEDGAGSAARFALPYGLAVDATGNAYVTDFFNHTIRKVSPAGVVTTFAGLAGTLGSVDGPGSMARFSNPRGAALDGSGNLYVSDSSGCTIRKITPAGVVTTLAGLAGSCGSADGTGSAARLRYPSGVAVDSSGNVYVADYGNHTIRKVSAGGVVTTLSGLAGATGSADGTGSAARFSSPEGVTVDGSGTIYVTDSQNNTIRRVSAGGEVTTLAGLAGSSGSADGTGTTARFSYPERLTVDGSGNLRVADSGNGTIRKVTAAGEVTTLAGLAGSSGSVDGTGTAARFYYPTGVALDGSGNLYVADYNNCQIRKMAAGGEVTTVAGLVNARGSWADGTGDAARFNAPWGVAMDASGSTYVADRSNHTIRKVSPGGEATTFAGLPRVGGFADGTGSSARFRRPTGVAVDALGNAYVADSTNHTIRKVSPVAVVTTLAGLAVSPGATDGTGSAARFSSPIGVAVDASGIVYVADSGNHTIRKISPAGLVTTLAGLAGNPGSSDGTGTQARFTYPSGVAVDGSGTVYVADTNNSTIRKVTATGEVTTLAGLAGSYGATDGTGSVARFGAPHGVAVDGLGNVYVADAGYSGLSVRKVAPDGTVSTLGGPGVDGGNDGLGLFGRFRVPRGIAVGFDGSLVVGDTGNNAIRIGSAAALTDAATIDAPVGVVSQSRQLDASPNTATAWTWQLVRREAGSIAPLSTTTTRNPTFTPDVPGHYVFRLTASTGAGQAITEIGLDAALCLPPTPVPSNDGPKCEGSTVHLTTGFVAGATYSWTGPNSFTSAEQNPVLLNATTANAGLYTVTVTIAGCPSLSGQTTVVVNPVPEVPFVVAPATVPAGAAGVAASVAPHAGSSWAWGVQNGSITSGDGTNQIAFTAGSSGVVTLTVTETSSAGCSSSPGLASVAIAEALLPHVVNKWESVGPDGGEVYSIVVDPSTPSTVWAGTISGAFKSTDGGEHWAKMWSSGSFAYGLAVHPTNSSIVFLSDRSRQIYKSANGGVSWLPSSNGIPLLGTGNGFGRILFKPGNPTVLYYAWQSGLFKSVDSGANWAASDAGPVNGKTVLDLVLDPSSPDIVYLALSQFGVYKSVDGGATWGEVNSGLPTRLSGGVTQVPVSAFAMDPSNSQRLFVGSGKDGRVYLSTDGGTTWTARSASVPYVSSRSLVVAPGDGQTLYGGATDYAGANATLLNRLIKSTDGGATWASVSNSIWSSSSRPLAIPLASPSTVYASMGGRIWKTTDAGSSWRIASTGLRALEIGGVAFSPSNPSTWYSHGSSLGILRTTDGGATMSIVNQNVVAPANGNVGVDPGNPQVLVTAGSTRDGWTDMNNDYFDYLLRSVDGGATWSQVGNPVPSPDTWPGLQPWGLVALPTTPTTFFVAGASDGVYKSVDAGLTFSAKNTGLPAASGTSAFYYDIAAADTTGTTLYVAVGSSTAPGLYRSTNGGESWALSVAGMPANTAVRSVAVHPAAPQRVFAAVQNAAVHVSSDGGNSWSAATVGIPTTGAISVVISPSDASVVVATGSLSNVPWVSRSTDGGLTWSPVTIDGLDSPVVWELAIDPSNPNRIIAGGRGGLSAITLDSSDPQGNGIPASVENQVPGPGGAGAGDGNGDGVPDELQADVASLPGPVPGEWITVETSTEKPLSGVATISAPAPSGMPPGVTAPSGVVQFTVSGVSPGGCEVVTLLFPKNPAINGYFKYGPTPEDTSAHWYNFAFDGQTGATVSQDPDRTRIVLRLCDGLRGDGDLIANGAILDPGGPVVAAQCSTPATPMPTNDGPKCAGGTVHLTVDAVTGATYSWTGPNGFASNQQLPILSNLTAAMAGDYFVNVSVGACVSAVGTTTVALIPPPALPVISAPASVGPGQSFTAAVPGVAGVSYLWTVTNGTVTAGSGTQQISVTAGASGPVTISVRETNLSTGCVSEEASVSIPVGLAATRLYVVAPCRLFDTRESAGPSAGAPILAPGEIRTLSIETRCGLSPSTIRSLAVNQTVTQPTADGELVLYGGDLASPPITSNLSFRAGITRANNGILELSRNGDGTFNVYNRSAGSVHFILDVSGTFQ